MLKERIANTFGTDIRFVYDHLLGLPQLKTPQRVVILTDGFTGKPKPRQAVEAKRRKISVIVGLIGSGNAGDLIGHAAVIESLPELELARET